MRPWWILVVIDGVRVRLREFRAADVDDLMDVVADDEVTHEGRIRDHMYTNGAWRDSGLFSILDHEWPRNRRLGM